MQPRWRGRRPQDRSGPTLQDRLAELAPLLVVLLIVGGLQVARVGLDRLSAPAATPAPTPTMTITATVVRTRQRQLLPSGPRHDHGDRTSSPETCTADQPRFQGGLRLLKASLGRIMGDPLDCERVVNEDGDTEQHTSTGLAYYLKAQNVAAFTDGRNRWALTARGVVHWTGPQSSPPESASPLPE